MEKLAICGGKPVRETKIYYGHQYIDEADIQSVVNVLKSDYLTCGPKIKELEDKLCKMTGAKYSVAVSNGTAALHVACIAAGIGENDEIITSPITFAASANCALYCGAKPVFADINPKTYNIDPEEIERKITDKTKAIIAVDFTGQAVELDKIKEICNKNKLILIEDAAHSIGTTYKGIPVGQISDLTTFSFHPVKTITGGEGGAILTNDSALYEKLILFRSHGITRESELLRNPAEGGWYYEQIGLGYNYRMSDIQAALICSQLNKLEVFKKRRKEIVNMYNKAFESVTELFVQEEIPESDTTRHLYIIQLKPKFLKVDRKQIFDALEGENICCNVHYIPVYTFPYYEELGYAAKQCPNAENLYQNIITLPLYYAMKNKDVEDVIKAVKKVIDNYTCLQETI